MDRAERQFFEDIQLLLAKSKRLVSSQNDTRPGFQTVCGVDAAYSRDNRVMAVASSFDTEKGELLEQSEYEGTATFPYVSGLFFLREGPFVCEAVSSLKVRPDLVCFDAHGLAHPRNLGLATICGMVLGIRSIGVAKSKLMGELQSYKPGMNKLVNDNGEVMGFVSLEVNKGKHYWSPGNSISIGELESIISDYGSICLKSIMESHLRAQRTLHSRGSL